MRAPAHNDSLAMSGWPRPLGRAAMQGLIGDIVTTIAPHTEADPAGLLFQSLTAIGNLLGRRGHFVAGATRHGMNLFTVLVGQTSRARKGTSWDFIADLLKTIDPGWSDRNVIGGLGSGEGLIEAAAQLSDAAGVRVCCLEDEFAAALKVMARRGNILSTTLRRAWDGKNLQITTRQSPLLVRTPHVSLIGHVTQHDLERYLAHVEVFNGFANRVLWVCTQRSRFLPYGGRLPQHARCRLQGQLQNASEFALRVSEVGMSRKSRELWEERYPDLTANHSADSPTFNAATSRAEAQVRRVALVYAVTDGFHEVRIQHLRAAFEVWRFAEASARYLFGGLRSQARTHTILRMLPSSGTGMTRTEISKMLSHHRSSLEISESLSELRRQGRVTSKRARTGGRSAERWIATSDDAK